jgi:hypothetical protein
MKKSLKKVIFKGKKENDFIGVHCNLLKSSVV